MEVRRSQELVMKGFKTIYDLNSDFIKISFSLAQILKSSAGSTVI